VPELHVDVDDTAERGTRVLQLLHELEEGREPDELPALRESLPTPAPVVPPDPPGSTMSPARAGTRRRRRGRP
jgi:hypothetical protein